MKKKNPRVKWLLGPLPRVLNYIALYWGALDVVDRRALMEWMRQRFDDELPPQRTLAGYPGDEDRVQ